MDGQLIYNGNWRIVCGDAKLTNLSLGRMTREILEIFIPLQTWNVVITVYT
jgi:hypothetical protein